MDEPITNQGDPNLAPPPPAAPVQPDYNLNVKNLMTVKNEDGTNFFTDKHLEKLKNWSSDDQTKAKFRDKLGQAKLVKSYLELEEHQGRTSKPPADNASPEEIADYNKAMAKAMGVPDTPDDYKIIMPPGLPDEVKALLEDIDSNELKLIAHKHKISKDGLQAVYEMIAKSKVKDVQGRIDERNTDKTNAAARLKAIWGNEKYRQYIGDETNEKDHGLIGKFLRGYAQSEEEYTEFLSKAFEDGFGNNTLLLTAIADAAEKIIGEGKTFYEGARQAMSQQSSLAAKYPNSSKTLKV